MSDNEPNTEVAAYAAAPTTTITPSSRGTTQAASDCSSAAWDIASLQTFLSTTMPNIFDAGQAAEKLLENGYTTEQQLLGARREGLRDAGLKPGQIDQILGWLEGRPPQHLLTVKRDRTTWDIGGLLRATRQGLQDKILNWTIEPSVWQALGPLIRHDEIPRLVLRAPEKEGGEQGTKCKMFVPDTEDETANQGGKKRRLRKASRRPAIVEAPKTTGGTKWYQGSTLELDLFIRDCTMDCFGIMWDIVERQKKDQEQDPDDERCVSFIVKGPPGLGKSWSSNTIVWRLLKERQNIWFHSASEGTLTTFSFEGDDDKLTISEKPEEHVKRNKAPKWTWFLYDSVEGSSNKHEVISFRSQNVSVPCVIFSSPKETNYQQGIKDMDGAVLHLWMPSWEWHELEEVMPSFHKLYGTRMGLEEFSGFVHALYELWGGIPRRIVFYCRKLRVHGRKEEILRDSQNSFENELSKISNEIISSGPLGIHDVLKNSCERGEDGSQSRKSAPPSWLLFPAPVDSEERPFQKYAYRFCSQKAEIGFLDRLEKANADAVRTFCRDVFQVRGTAGIAFERFAHFVLTRTQSNTFRWRQYNSAVWGSVVLPKCERKNCEMTGDLDSFGSAIKECIGENKSVVISPKSDQQDAIDMFVVCKLDNRWRVLAMQDTISKTHSFHPVKILEYRQAAKKAFEAAMPGQKASDDFFLHVVVVPEEGANDERFRLQKPTMPDLSQLGHVEAKFKEIGLEVPGEFCGGFSAEAAVKVCQAANLKDRSKLRGNELKMAGAKVLLLNNARDTVIGLTRVLDGFFNHNMHQGGR